MSPVSDKKRAGAGFIIIEMLLAVILISLSIEITLRAYKASNFSIVNARHRELLNYIELFGQRMIGESPSAFLALNGSVNPYTDLNRPDMIEKVNITVKLLTHAGSTLDYLMATVSYKLKQKANPQTFQLYKEVNSP